MKKRIQTFRLSDDAIDILERKAKLFKLNKTEVLEAMILEFSPSTEEEFLQQRKDRDKIRDAFLKTHTKVHKDIWQHGYISGWTLFQLRKKSSLFRKSKDPRTQEWMKKFGI